MFDLRTGVMARTGLLAGVIPVSLLASVLLAQDAPRLVRGPYLQSLLSDSVTVIWLTDLPTVGKVRLTMEDGTVRLVEDTRVTSRHDVHVTGLSPASRHSYEVLAGDTVLAQGPAFSFRTAPSPGTGSFRAAVIGDSGQGDENQQGVTAIIEETIQPDLFLHTGDVWYVSSLNQVLFQEYRQLFSTVGMYPARGNHAGFDPAEWFLLFSPPEVDLDIPACELPPSVCDEDPPEPIQGDGERTSTFYSFDWGPAHFAVLDSNDDFEECSIQMKWLCVDLAAARERERAWIILIVHQPPYTTGGYSSSELPATRLIPPIADRFGVDLVISGHDHNYQRSFPLRGGQVVDGWQDPSFVLPRGTVYLVSGGGGALSYGIRTNAEQYPLFRVARSVHHAVELEVSLTELKVRALTPEDEGGPRVLDQWSIRKSGERPEPGFLRGDSNFDGDLNLTDAIVVLQFLFLGLGIDCPAVFPFIGDVDGSNRVDIADPIYLLNYLFRGGAPPAEPLGVCETVPGVDVATCARASCRL